MSPDFTSEQHAQEKLKVQQSMARFEAAMDRLSQKVEHTGNSVREKIDTVKKVQDSVERNAGTVILGAMGLIAGYLLVHHSRKAMAPTERRKYDTF